MAIDFQEQPPPRPTAQVIDYQAARARAGRDPAPMRLFTPPRPGLLSPQEHWALGALQEHLRARNIAPPDPAPSVQPSGRFDLQDYIARAKAVRDQPIVLPLPTPAPGFMAHLFGGAFG